MPGAAWQRHPALLYMSSLPELGNAALIVYRETRGTNGKGALTAAGNPVEFFRRQLASATATQYSVRHE